MVNIPRSFAELGRCKQREKWKVVCQVEKDALARGTCGYCVEHLMVRLLYQQDVIGQVGSAMVQTGEGASGTPEHLCSSGKGGYH